MTKKDWILTLMLMISLMLPVQASLADEPLDPLVAPAAPPVVQVEAEFADELQQAIAALQAQKPGAVVDYAVRERDDGRYEWELFFTLNGQLGQCEVREENFEVRRTVLYDKPVDGRTASEVVAELAKAKGEVTIIDLELDRDDGRLRYEGEAMLNDKHYEFEISISGEIIEWERD